MNKILIIDESKAFRDMAEKLCVQNNLEPHLAINGLDGNSKILRIIPDLIIMENELTRMDCITVLNKKKQNPNTTNIPVIFVSKSAPDKSFLIKTIPFGVKKFLKKPMGMETLLIAISDILHIDTEIDSTPCVLEVRLNENILFVEVAMGLNRNRLEVVKYRIAELIKLHKVKFPLVLLMMTDIPFGLADRQKLTSLIEYCIEGAGVDDTKIRVLTPSSEIKIFLNTHTTLYDILVEDSLENVMDGFVNKSRSDLLFTQNETHKDESINVNYRSEDQGTFSRFEDKNDNKVIEKMKVAVVDDDKVVHAIIKSVFRLQDWDMCYYLSGSAFLEEPHIDEFDLVILDLIMPEVSGFDVLSVIKKEMFDKIIVLTSSTRRHDVMKVLSYGIKNYSVKPINGEGIKLKALDIINNKRV